MASLLNLLLTGLVGLACAGSGRTLLIGLGFRFNTRSAEAMLSIGVGFGILIYSMVLFGAAGLYQPVTAWSFLFGLALLGAWGGWRWPALWRGDNFARWSWQRRLTWPFLLLLLTLFVYIVLYLLVALTPTLEGDSLSTYLLTARDYARQGSLLSVDYARGDSFPANGQMLAVFGFLLQGQILAQLLLVWLMGLIALCVLYSFGRSWLSRRAALAAMTIWYGMYSMGYLATSGKIDLAWAAFDGLALLAFSHWYFAKPTQREFRWLVLAGFFLSVAGGIKQASVFSAIILSLAIGVRLWQGREFRLKIWSQTYLALSIPMLLALGWVVRTYLLTGSFVYSGGDLPGESGIYGFLRSLWHMSLLGNASALEGPLGKSIGPAILATVPLLAVCRRVDHRIWHILAFCLLMLVLWFNGVQRARHLLPTLALLSLIAGHVASRLLVERPRLGQLIVVFIVVSLGLNLGTWGYVNFVSLQRLPYVLGLQDRDGYLAVNLTKLHWYPNDTIVKYARDSLPEHARIAALSSSNGYYLERPFYANWQTAEEVSSLHDFVAQLRANDIAYVFTNEYVIAKRHLKDAWLVQPAFQKEYLQELICADGQCLYAFQ